jgi:hypothetical protein
MLGLLDLLLRKTSSILLSLLTNGVGGLLCKALRARLVYTLNLLYQILADQFFGGEIGRPCHANSWAKK